MHVLKPVEYSELADKKFPLFCTPKIDGIRAYVNNGALYTASNKPVPNRQLQSLASQLPNGSDMELFYDNFRTTSSIVMSERAVVPSGLTAFVFDLIPFDNVGAGYLARLRLLTSYLPQCESHFNRTDFTETPVFSCCRKTIQHKYTTTDIRVTALLPIRIDSEDDLKRLVDSCVLRGEEGVMCRYLHSPYKFGRSTPLSAELIRYKPFLDAEAIIVGCEPQYENQNTAYVDEKGRTKRSSSTDGLVPRARLGAFTCIPYSVESLSTLQGPYTFSVGNGLGLTHRLRDELWANRDSLIGKVIKYKYLPVGDYDHPRSGVFLGFRDPSDLTTY